MSASCAPVAPLHARLTGGIPISFSARRSFCKLIVGLPIAATRWPVSALTS